MPLAPDLPWPTDSAASPAVRGRPDPEASAASLRVDDLLHTFLASNGGGTSPAMRVARALRQFFVAPRVQVVIGRYRSDAGEPVEVHSSAQCLTLRRDPEGWDAREAEQFLRSMASHSFPHRPVQVAPIKWSLRLSEADRRIWVGLAWADPHDGFSVWSRLEGLSDVARARVQANALDRDLSNMRLFASAIRSVHLVERAQSERERIEKLRGDLDELLLAADPRKRADLANVLAILRNLVQSGNALERVDVQEQVRRVASLALNRTLQALEPVDQALATELCSHLCTLGGRLPGEAAEELRCIASCILPGEEGANSACEAGSLTLQAMRLLASATRALSRAARVRTATDERECAEQHLPELCRAIRAALPNVLLELAQNGERRSEQLVVRSLDTVRTWLRLWFVMDVASIHCPVSTAAPVRALAPEQFEVFGALALVLRESLRQQLYLGSPGFEQQERAIRAALRVLVQHHARWKSGVPRELDLPGHLEDVGANRQGVLEAEGHLEHVSDVYVTGYFCANLRIGPPSVNADPAPRHRAAMHIVGQVELGPSPKASADFHIAFALAALFHDSGMMLFSSVPQADRALHEVDDVARALACIRDNVCDAGRKLVETCVRELELHECIDLAQEQELETWVERQRVTGEPNHALLSAWYLLKVCTRAACLRPEVIRSAVRATLLHGALGVAVDSAQDGVAALLVLCDEICDWPPVRSSSSQTGRDGRLLNDRGPMPAQHSSRTQTVGIAGLWFELDEQGALRVGLEPCDQPAEDREACWPHITLGLRPCRDLAGAVLELWLRSAQNIGRIRRSGGGWAPSITIEGEVPPRLLAVGQTTRTLLDATAQRTRSAIRGRLHQWLENSAVFPECEQANSPVEAVHLVGLSRPLASDDIAQYLPELIETAFLVLEDRERGTRR